MTHGSLFNGIGGFQLAAEWMGWENVFSCEIDSFCNKVTKYHFPNCVQHEDIRTTDFSIYRGAIDIITGGFPCQPFSTAGKRKGKADERHLWPEMLRAIREIQPGWVVGENVPGLLNWGRGMVLHEIKTDLEAEGFEVFPPLVLPACGKDAPHKRDRLWIVAHATGYGSSRASNETGREAKGQNRGTVEQSTKRSKIWAASYAGLQRQKIAEQQAMGVEQLHESRDITNTQRFGQQGLRWSLKSSHKEAHRDWKASWAYDDGRWPTESPVCGRNDGIPYRVDRLKALGNAIVPQVAYEIFKAIELSS